MLPNVVQLSPPIYVPKGCPSKISPTAETCAYHSEVEESAGLLGQGYVSIDMLPDELLLGIFYLLCVDDDYEKGCEPTWEMLVHVCRRWRHIVFAAPRRLDLRLLCTSRTPVVRKLDVWPALPIVIRAADYGGFDDNAIAALKHNDRISEIYILWLSRSGPYQLRKRKVMQDPYPALTDLRILSHVAVSPALPDSFLGGSAPRLRSLHLRGVGFPALPKLLLSSSAGLVSLTLWEIPHRNVFSAEAMVDCLSSLTNLEKLRFDFTCCRSSPIRRQYSPHARTALPVLYSLSLKGLIEHLQDFYARIETPLLKDSHLEFLDPDIFDISTISPFVRHKEPFQALDQAHMVLNGFNLNIRLSSRDRPTTGGKSLMLSFMHNNTLRWRWRLRFLTQDHRPFSPRSTSPPAEFDRLNGVPFKDQNSPHWLRTMIGNARLRELLRAFPSVKDLYLSEGLAVLVIPALQELAAREGVLVATQVLPALQTLFVERHWFRELPEKRPLNLKSLSPQERPQATQCLSNVGYRK